ncbi:YjeF N-terminal domain-like protein [Ascodesmis nigricans]|uniref:NAD(P)H-hydrate epimerase n=1 Tax=Ascodesmis nigricans TaxID=341454 RepID=A0A4S2N1W0_9PEZI|nr:YjeF N-terminal domain-like protein [Ascodesmis nigricans]
MALRTITAKAAAELDKELMSTGAFSIDQLMELAGLAVAQTVYKVHPPQSNKPRVLIACGPGNNGGDGLVCARHLHHFHYRPSIFYPKQPKNPLYQHLLQQCRDLGIPEVTDFNQALLQTDHIVDAIFGFSFQAPIRDPFPSVLEALAATTVPVTSVDAPSGWDITNGPPDEGPVKGWHPDYLVSLTAPKPLVKFFKGKRHFVGGRFVSPGVAERWGVDVPKYEGVDQVVEVPVESMGGERVGEGEKGKM